MTEITGPHQWIKIGSRREQFIADLFDRLWDRYRQRVAYVSEYERMVADEGARFINDHIAFRTIGLQTPLSGIVTLSRIFEALGYQAAGVYDFADKHLSATHFQHPHPEFPKLFISELRSWELSGEARGILEQSLASNGDAVSGELLAALHGLDAAAEEIGHDELLSVVDRRFRERPWPLPDEADVRRLNQESQYGAWVMVHGYEVNHFTSLVNSHGVDSLDTIDKTVAALRRRGVPMKASIEGQPGSKLRQSATEAVMIDVDVVRDGEPAKMAWSYAYFELAERNRVADPGTGKQVRFEGFLGPQATHLFEMTKVDD